MPYGRAALNGTSRVAIRLAPSPHRIPEMRIAERLPLASVAIIRVFLKRLCAVLVTMRLKHWPREGITFFVSADGSRCIERRQHVMSARFIRLERVLENAPIM